MNKLHGLLAIGGFMATMLCYVAARIEVTKLDLIITFLTWIGVEVLIFGIQELVRFILQDKKGTEVETSVHFRS